MYVLWIKDIKLSIVYFANDVTFSVRFDVFFCSGPTYRIYARNENWEAGVGVTKVVSLRIR